MGSVAAAGLAALAAYSFVAGAFAAAYLTLGRWILR